jgi:predicted TIM-barrel fold metal-dependent hydrolase
LKIDLHAHAFPAEFFHEINRLYPETVQLKHDREGQLFAVWANTPLPCWNLEQRIADLDRAGIDLQVLSNPPLYNRLDEHSPALCRMVNNALAEACRAAPDRLRAFAHLPFNDMRLALTEMAYALDDLGFAGVLITSNVGGRYLDAPEFYPFWEEVNRRRVCVFLHPSKSRFYQDDEPATMLTFPFDTTLAAHKLIRSGLYQRFPEVVLVLAHLGGALPYLARRIDISHDFHGFFANYKMPARRPSQEMRKLYVETALGWQRSAFDCARELVGIEHIVFGSDCFLRDMPFMDWTSQFIDGLGLEPREREMIYCETASRILRLNAY